VEPSEQGGLVVRGLQSAEIGAIAAAEGIVLSELTSRRASLEDAFFELTHDLTLSTATTPTA
jgi:ABC-2 type transport system ATP-binding protein